MKKFSLFFLATFLLGGLFFAHNVLAQEKIDSFDVTVQMNQDNSINITEKIIYDFGDLEKHGIYRDIPYIYGGGLTARHTDISAVTVVDENNQPLEFAVSKKGNDKSIKIGQADVLVSGVKTYIISYRVENAFIFDKQKDQFYWDIIGGAWQVPIVKSTATVWLPQIIENSTLQARCYTGAFESKKQCDAFVYLFDAGDTSRVKGITFRQSDVSVAGILTVLVDMPVGSIVVPSQQQKIISFLKYNGIIFLPLIVFILMFVIWYRRGRDPKGRGNIIVQYDVPDGLSPAELGTIVDEKVQNKDISAEIIYLAIQGYLKITRVQKSSKFNKSSDYLLEKFKDGDDLQNDFQKEIMLNLFAKATEPDKLKDYSYVPDSRTKVVVRLSDLDEAYRWRATVTSKIYETVVSKAYFINNPNKVRVMYSLLFFGVVGFIWVVINNIVSIYSPLTFLAGLSSVLIIVLFGWHMPKRTKKGVLTKEYILGLKQYLSVAERDRLNFHNAPEKNPQHFEALLPYAMVLGVEKQWAKQFEGIYIDTSAWCTGFYVGSFSSRDFTNSLNSFGSQAKSTFATPSSGAGGGGFAGGGGGGGGGGSW